jgi:hypothetical protein
MANLTLWRATNPSGELWIRRNDHNIGREQKVEVDEGDGCHGQHGA